MYAYVFQVREKKKIYKCSRYFHICADVESIMLYTETAGFLARKENIDRNQLHSDRKKKETGRNVCSYYLSECMQA